MCMSIDYNNFETGNYSWLATEHKVCLDDVIAKQCLQTST